MRVTGVLYFNRHIITSNRVKITADADTFKTTCHKVFFTLFTNSLTPTGTICESSEGDKLLDCVLRLFPLKGNVKYQNGQRVTLKMSLRHSNE